MGEFFPYPQRETTVLTSGLLHWTPDRLSKGANPKRKEFALSGGKFLPFKVDPFSEMRQSHYDREVSLESVPFPTIYKHHSIFRLNNDWIYMGVFTISAKTDNCFNSWLALLDAMSLLKRDQL